MDFSVVSTLLGSFECSWWSGTQKRRHRTTDGSNRRVCFCIDGAGRRYRGRQGKVWGVAVRVRVRVRVWVSRVLLLLLTRLSPCLWCSGPGSAAVSVNPANMEPVQDRG